LCPLDPREGEGGVQVVVGAAPVAAVGEHLGGGLVRAGLVGPRLRGGVGAGELLEPDDRCGVEAADEGAGRGRADHGCAVVVRRARLVGRRRARLGERRRDRSADRSVDSSNLHLTTSGPT
jgi:hypothetical protein